MSDKADTLPRCECGRPAIKLDGAKNGVCARCAGLEAHARADRGAKGNRRKESVLASGLSEYAVHLPVGCGV